MKRMLAIGEDGVLRRFEAPSTESEEVLRVQDEITEEYGDEYDCVILPEGTSPDHPLVQSVDETMKIPIVEVLENE